MTNIATLLVGFGMFGSFILIPQLAEAPDLDRLRLRPRRHRRRPADAPRRARDARRRAVLGRARAPLRRQGAARRWARSSPPSRSLRWASTTARRRAMVAWNIVLSIGIGLAFAAMPNLIFDAVPQSETGEATGFNTLVRSVGASLGSQISAAILTGSVIAGRRAARPTTATRPRSSSRPASRWWPRSSRSRSRASGDSVRVAARPAIRREPALRGAMSRHAPHPRRRRPQLRAGARGRGRGARGEGRGGRRAGDRRARRRRQGHGLPLLPDQGAPDLGGARASGCARSRRPPARPPSSPDAWEAFVELLVRARPSAQAGDCTFSAGLSHESDAARGRGGASRRCTTRWTR